MNTFDPRSTDEWRTWLDAHGRSETEVWLVVHHKDSGTPSLSYDEAIAHALCFGWIDSQARKHDERSSVLRFTPRRPGSSWSRLNRERAARMIAQGLMTARGQSLIDDAKAHGRWELVMPEDLAQELAQDEGARRNFETFPPSSQRLILEWIASAKKPETRASRIKKTVADAARNVRPR